VALTASAISAGDAFAGNHIIEIKEINLHGPGIPQ
jgi:hypothetical protein